MSHRLDHEDCTRLEIDVSATETKQLPESRRGVRGQVNEAPIARIDRSGELLNLFNRCDRSLARPAPLMLHGFLAITSSSTAV
jgi:hypothetical protein